MLSLARVSAFLQLKLPKAQWNPLFTRKWWLHSWAGMPTGPCRAGQGPGAWRAACSRRVPGASPGNPKAEALEAVELTQTHEGTECRRCSRAPRVWCGGELHGCLPTCIAAWPAPAPSLLPSRLSGLLAPPAPSSLLAQSFTKEALPDNYPGMCWVPITWDPAAAKKFVSSTCLMDSTSPSSRASPDPAFSTWCMLYVRLL